jgi:hypothetical protein
MIMLSKQSTRTSYVKRELDLFGEIESRLNQLKAGEDPAELIYNIYGLVGIGKTCVLQQLFDQTSRDMYDVVWLDFDLKDQADIATDTHPQRPLHLTQASWIDAITTLSAIPGLKGRIPQHVSYDDKLSLPLEHMGNLLTSQNLDGTDQRPLLLILDSLDNLPYWKWLQEQVIKPLLELQHTLIVCASRAPLFWHYWEIRESCKADEIPTFRKEETQEFLRRYNRAPLADAVHPLANGYPLVLKQFIKLIDEPAERPIAVDIPALERSEALQPQILPHIGSMRRIHVAVMQKLLEHGMPDYDWESPPMRQQLIAALKAFKDQGYIKIHHDTSDRFAPELRAALRDKPNPDAYRERCRIIADSYYEIARKQPRTEDCAIIEWLFFSTEPFADDTDDSRLAWESERSAWGNALNKLIVRVKEVYRSSDSAGPNLVRQLYLDGELLQHLTQLDVLSTVQETMHPLIEGRPMLLRRDVARACSQALAIIGERFMGMTHDDFVSFETALRSLRPAGGADEYDQETLRDSLIKEWPALQHRPARSLTELIVLMNGDGVLTYDRHRRMYQFHPMIDHLLSIDGRERRSTAHTS